MRGSSVSINFQPQLHRAERSGHFLHLLAAAFFKQEQLFKQSVEVMWTVLSRPLHSAVFQQQPKLTAAGDMSQSLVDSGVPLSSFPLMSSSFLLAGSSASRISKACWNSLAAY